MEKKVVQKQESLPKVVGYSSRTKLKRDIVTNLRNLMSRFYLLSSFDDKAKDRYKKVLRNYEKRTAVYVTLKDKIGAFYTTTVFVANFIMLGFVLPIFTIGHLNLGFGITIGAIFLSNLALFLHWRFIPKLLNVFDRNRAFTLIATFLLVFLSLTALLNYSNWFVYLVLLMGAIFFLGFASLYIELLMFALIELVFKRWYIKQDPMAFIVDNYLKVLFLMEKSAFSWTDKTKKEDIVVHLNDISNAISWYLPKYIKLDDSLLSTLLLDKIEKISSTIKFIEMKILMPEEKEEHDLYLKLSTQFMAFLSGYWGDFVLEEIPKITRPQRFLYIWSFFKEFMVAILPISAILLFQSSSYAQPVDTISYFVALSLIWAVVRLINIINPSALESLSNLKDITSLVSNQK